MSAVESVVDLERRFAGVARLYGAELAARFASARVCVIGIGGVGSWAVEALARNGIGMIRLIDLDMVAESNTNRQIHALGDAYGMAKVEAMRARILAINPACQVEVIEDFIQRDNMAKYLADVDVVLDAIDQVHEKVALVVHCRDVGLPLVICGAAGGKQDPARIKVADVTRAEQDGLLAKLRKQLRIHHGFPRDIRRRWGIRCVYSDEPIQMPGADADEAAACATGEAGNAAPQGLSCAGYGSGVCVTAPFGFFAAAQVLECLREGLLASKEM